jgi:hypothetical protein
MEGREMRSKWGIVVVLTSLWGASLLGADKPAQIVELWTATATKTGAGPVVNPPEFIKAVRARMTKTNP